MRRQLLPALRMMVVFTVVLGLAYPLVDAGRRPRWRSSDKANGSLVKQDGQVVGSSLLGQTFTGDTLLPGPAVGRRHHRQRVDRRRRPARRPEPTCRCRTRGGSNLGPTNPTLLDGATDDPSTPDVDESRRRRDPAGAGLPRRLNGLAADAPVPVDAVTSSGSGVDPQISVANARLQANRVAQARGLDVSVVNQLIDQHTHGRSPRLPGRAGRQRARAQPGPGRPGMSRSTVLPDPGSPPPTRRGARWASTEFVDSGHEPRPPAHLPGCGARRGQDLRHARRGLPPPRARHRRGGRLRRDPRPAQDGGPAARPRDRPPPGA